jgi:hypothetical protein
MEKRNYAHQVVVRNENAGYTDVWEKNSAGNTTKEGFSRHYHDSGNVTDYYGNKISNTKGK